jgi:porin
MQPSCHDSARISAEKWMRCLIDRNDSLVGSVPAKLRVAHLFGVGCVLSLVSAIVAPATLWADAAATTTEAAAQAPTEEAPVTTAPALKAPELTLLPPPEADDRDAPSTTAPSSSKPAFVPYSDGNINLALKEASNQPEGILPYGPVSLLYPLWKQATTTLSQKIGLNIGFESDLVYQGATGGPGIRTAGGGYVALFGDWRLLGTSDGDNNGYLKFKAEYNWQIGSEAPAALGHQIGSLWGTTKGFGEDPPCASQLYWEQHFMNSMFILAIGKIDPTNYYANNIWQSDKQFFMNGAFSNIPAVGAPGNGLGMNAKFTPSPWLYLSAGFQDQQGTKTSPGFDTFFTDFDLFSAGEIGLTPDIPGLGHGNYRFTLWHADAVPTTSKPSDEGFALSFDQAITPNIIPFFRYEYAEGALTHIHQLVTGGVGVHGTFLSKQDVSGIALAWGQPTNDRRQQWTAETFYRIQLSPANQLSIGYQLILDPTSSNQDAVGVTWVRFRVLF